MIFFVSPPNPYMGHKMPPRELLMNLKTSAILSRSFYSLEKILKVVLLGPQSDSVLFLRPLIFMQKDLLRILEFHPSMTRSSFKNPKLRSF